MAKTSNSVEMGAGRKQQWGPRPWDNQYTFCVVVAKYARETNGVKTYVDRTYKGMAVGKIEQGGLLAIENKQGVYGSEKNPIRPTTVYKNAREFVLDFIEKGFPLAATSVRNGEDDNFKGKNCPRKTRDPYTSEELRELLAQCESVVMIRETRTPAIQFNYKKAAKKSPAKKPAKKAASGTLMG